MSQAPPAATGPGELIAAIGADVARARCDALPAPPARSSSPRQAIRTPPPSPTRTRPSLPPCHLHAACRWQPRRQSWTALPSRRTATAHGSPPRPGSRALTCSILEHFFYRVLYERPFKAIFGGHVTRQTLQVRQRGGREIFTSLAHAHHPVHAAGRRGSRVQSAERRVCATPPPQHSDPPSDVTQNHHWTGSEPEMSQPKPPFAEASRRVRPGLARAKCIGVYFRKTQTVMPDAGTKALVEKRCFTTLWWNPWKSRRARSQARARQACGRGHP